MRDFDEFERGFVQTALEILVAIEIAIGLLNHDVAFQQQALQHLSISKLGYLASRAPRAMFSKSRKTAMVASDALLNMRCSLVKTSCS